MHSRAASAEDACNRRSCHSSCRAVIPYCSICGYADLPTIHKQRSSEEPEDCHGPCKAWCSFQNRGGHDARVKSAVHRSAPQIIFRRDLKFCSSFNKLKSLLLDEYWCKPADFSALACFLKLSPVLEKLTLQLYSKGPKHKVEIKLSCKPLETSAAISQHLKTLEVKCEVYDARVHNVLTFLSE